MFKHICLVILSFCSFQLLASEPLLRRITSDDISSLYSNTIKFEISDRVKELLRADSFELGELVDFPLVIVKKKSFVDEQNRIRWTGYAEGDPRSSVHITYNQNKSFLSGQLALDEKSYQLTAIGKNTNTVSQIKKS